MCCDHPFSQRNRKTERTVGVGVGGDKEVWGLDKTWKGGSGRQYRGDLHKIVGLAPLCQLRKETFPSPHYKTHPQHKLFFTLVTIIEREKIGTQNTKNNFFPRWVLFFKGSCTLFHCFYILSNLKELLKLVFLLILWSQTYPDVA